MKDHRYTSFEQIDTRLKILSVEQELGRYRIRKALSEARTPVLLTEIWEVAKPVVRTVLISWAVRKLKDKLEEIGARVSRNLPASRALPDPQSGSAETYPSE